MNPNRPSPWQARVRRAPLLVSEGLVTAPTSAQNGRTLLLLTMQPSRIRKMRVHSIPAARLLPDQRRPPPHTRETPGRKTGAALESAADSIRRREYSPTSAGRKHQDPKLAHAPIIRTPAAGTDLPSQMTLEVCPGNLRPVGLAVSCSIRDATILSSLHRSREATAMLVQILVLPPLSSTKGPPFSPRF